MGGEEWGQIHSATSSIGHSRFIFKTGKRKNKEQGTNHAAAMVSTLELCSPTGNDYDSGFDSEDYDSAEEDLGAEDDAE